MKKTTPGAVAMKALGAAVLLFGLIFSLLPLFWILISSIKPDTEVIAFPVIYIPSQITFAHYKIVWTDYPVARWYLNTIYVALSSTLLSMVLASFAAYALSRYDIRNKGALLIVILLSQMFPAILIVIPYYMWIARIGLINSYTGLIGAYIGGCLPYAVWTLKGFFDTIPVDLNEAALLDGCNEANAFFRIVLPVSAPGISAATLYCFLVAWNNYLYALILTSREKMLTLNVGIMQFVGDMSIRWGDLNALAVLTSFPIIIAFVIFEKQLIAGLTNGAVKG